MCFRFEARQEGPLWWQSDGGSGIKIASADYYGKSLHKENK